MKKVILYIFVIFAVLVFLRYIVPVISSAIYHLGRLIYSLTIIAAVGLVGFIIWKTIKDKWK
jgi:hypothetical protein